MELCLSLEHPGWVRRQQGRGSTHSAHSGSLCTRPRTGTAPSGRCSCRRRCCSCRRGRSRGPSAPGHRLQKHSRTPALGCTPEHGVGTVLPSPAGTTSLGHRDKHGCREPGGTASPRQSKETKRIAERFPWKRHSVKRRMEPWQHGWHRSEWPRGEGDRAQVLYLSGSGTQSSQAGSCTSPSPGGNVPRSHSCSSAGSQGQTSRVDTLPRETGRDFRWLLEPELLLAEPQALTQL